MKLIHILLVEDNEGDIMLTKEALEESKIIDKITVIKDGSAAINYFNNLKPGDYWPDLVLLDINLPKKSGHEVLQYIKCNDTFKHIPVTMLTTSSAERDILLAYKNYVNSFISKPVDVNAFMETISRVEDFWVNLVSIPKN